MPDDKRDLIPQARALYAQHMPLEEVAAAVGVSPSTLRRWKARDAKAGSDWDAQRDARSRRDPRALIAILEDRLATIAAEEVPAEQAGSWADRLQKVSNVLNQERARVGDLSVILGALSGLASWVHEHLSDEDLRLVSRIIEAYLSDLKERAL